MGNATGTNWDFSSIPANPTNGTGLALSLIGQAEYSSQLRLFYQVDNTGLVVADWASQAQIAAGDGMYSYILSIVSLACFAIYSTCLPNDV